MNNTLSSYFERLGLVLTFFAFGSFAPDSIRNMHELIVAILVLGCLLTIISGFRKRNA